MGKKNKLKTEGCGGPFVLEKKDELEREGNRGSDVDVDIEIN